MQVLVPLVGRNTSEATHYSKEEPHKLVLCLPGAVKGALYIIWCGVNRLGDTSAFVIPPDASLLTRRGKTRMYTVGIVFELYTVPL